MVSEKKKEDREEKNWARICGEGVGIRLIVLVAKIKD